MTDRYVDVNSQSNLHADKNMTTKDFENLGFVVFIFRLPFASAWSSPQLPGLNRGEI